MTFNYDFTDAAEGGDFVTLDAGRYLFKFIKGEPGESNAKKPKAIITLQVINGSHPEFNGGIINQHWPTTGSASFRFRDFVTAIGAQPKGKGKIDLRKKYGATIGAIVTQRPGDQPDQDGNTIYFNDLRNIVPGEQYAGLFDDDDEFESDDEFDEEYEDEEEEEVEDEDEEDEIEDDEEELSVDDLDDMSLGDLKELAEEYDISTEPGEGKSRLSKSQMVARLTEELFESDEDGEEEDEELSPDDLDEMNLSELKELASEYEVKLPRVPKGKKLTAARLRKHLVERLWEEDEDEEDEEPF